jgi:DNA-binding transcriptional regulator LsrR (DeoR family)
MIDKEEHKLLVDVSVLYYLEGKTQNEIANQLFLSRPKVSRLLKKAREAGIVEINIQYETDELEQLKNEVKEIFHIEKLVLVKTLSDSQDTLVEVGKAAASTLNEELTNDITIGISWGRSVRMTATQLKKREISNIRIVELFGAYNYDLEHTDKMSIGRILSSKLNGKFYPLPSPLYIANDQAKEAIISTPVIIDSLKMIEACDLIITGVGAIGGEAVGTIWENHIPEELKEKIIARKGVGFLCAHFFDEKGNFLDMKVNDSIVGIRTESIKEKRSLVVASGADKGKAILGALRGGLVSILVSDEETIRHVLELNNCH